jgi:hypothetical protein
MKNPDELVQILNLLSNDQKIELFSNIAKQDANLGIIMLEKMEITEDDELRQELFNHFFNYDLQFNGTVHTNKVKNYLETLFVNDIINILPEMKTQFDFYLLEYKVDLNILSIENFKKLINYPVHDTFETYWKTKLCDEFDFYNNNVDKDALKLISEQFFNLEYYKQKQYLLDTDIVSYLPKDFISQMAGNNNIGKYVANIIVDFSQNNHEINEFLLNHIKNSLSKKENKEVLNILSNELFITNVDIDNFKKLREIYPFNIENSPEIFNVINEINNIVEKLEDVEGLSNFVNYCFEKNEKCILIDKNIIVDDFSSFHDNQLFSNPSLLAKLIYISDLNNHHFNEKVILGSVIQIIQNNIEQIKFNFEDESFDEDMENSSESVDSIISQLEKYVFENNIDNTIKGKKLKL